MTHVPLGPTLLLGAARTLVAVWVEGAAFFGQSGEAPYDRVVSTRVILVPGGS